MLANALPYGRKYAILISTFFFVIGHNNPVNMLLAIVPGILFGYVASESQGIKYSFWGHVFVNIRNPSLVSNLLQIQKYMS